MQEPRLQAEYISAQVMSSISTILGHEVDTMEPLTAAGLDSLGAVELRNSLEEDLGMSLPATLLFDYPTAQDINAFLQVCHPPARPHARSLSFRVLLAGCGCRILPSEYCLPALPFQESLALSAAGPPAAVTDPSEPKQYQHLPDAEVPVGVRSAAAPPLPGTFVLGMGARVPGGGNVWHSEVRTSLSCNLRRTSAVAFRNSRHRQAVNLVTCDNSVLLPCCPQAGDSVRAIPWMRWDSEAQPLFKAAGANATRWGVFLEVTVHSCCHSEPPQRRPPVIELWRLAPPPGSLRFAPS